MPGLSGKKVLQGSQLLDGFSLPLQSRGREEGINMKKKKMILTFTPTWEVDVTDWYEGERLSPKEREQKLKEDFENISVFMNHAEYQNLKGVEVKVTEI